VEVILVRQVQSALASRVLSRTSTPRTAQISSVQVREAFPALWRNACARKASLSVILVCSTRGQKEIMYILMVFTHSTLLRVSLVSAGLLTRDPRVVERKKPGQKKARKKFQWVKR